MTCCLVFCLLGLVVVLVHWGVCLFCMCLVWFCLFLFLKAVCEFSAKPLFGLNCKKFLHIVSHEKLTSFILMHIVRIIALKKIKIKG